MTEEVQSIQDETWDLLDELFNELSQRVSQYGIDTQDIINRINPIYDKDEEEAEDDDTNDFHELDPSQEAAIESNDSEDKQQYGIDYYGEDPNVFQKPPTDRPLIGPDHWVALHHTLGHIESAIFSRDSSQVIYLFSQTQDLCHNLDIESGIDIDEIKDMIDILHLKTASLLYSPPKPTLIIPELIIPVESHLVSMIRSNPNYLFNIKPREFEELIAELFHDFGFEIELTQSTRDGGKDIIAIYEAANIRTKYLIECKRYKPTRKVSVSIVQRLYGVKISEAANKAILVTTSSFTKDAIAFASNHFWDLDLKGYDDVVHWVKRYKTTERPFL